MFTGHFAPALAAAALPGSPRLGVLIAASQLVDLGFFSLMVAGVEKMRHEPGATVMNPMDLYFMPYTHSLPGTLAWAVGFGLLVWIVTRNRTGGLIAAAVVLSHWLLDFVTHRPDLGLIGDSYKVGLGLWNHPAIEMPLEAGLLLGGAWLYARATRPATPAGRWSIPAFVALLLLMQAVDWFGPKPAAVDAAVPAQALFAYLVVIITSIWVSRTRSPQR